MRRCVGGEYALDCHRSKNHPMKHSKKDRCFFCILSTEFVKTPTKACRKVFLPQVIQAKDVRAGKDKQVSELPYLKNKFRKIRPQFDLSMLSFAGHEFKKSAINIQD